MEGVETFVRNYINQDNHMTAWPYAYAVQELRGSNYFTRQYFFTQEAAERHLEINRHNLNNPRLYVIHLRRNEEAELVLRTLFSLAGEDYDIHKQR